jgi:hypothetical protein
LRCVQYSFQLQDRSCSIQLSNPDQEINYATGVFTNSQGSDCRLFYTVSFEDQTMGNSFKTFKYCLVKKAADDYYISPAVDVPIVERPDLNCKTIDTAG